MIYFDNAATTFPKPVSVARAAQSGIEVYGGNPGRSGHRLSLKTGQKIFETRTHLADFFGGCVEGTVFTANCTEATNMAIKGIAKPGGHFICSDLEHNAVLRPLQALTDAGTITYSVAETDLCDSQKTVEAFEALICPETQAIVCTHASNTLGLILPIRQLGALCKQYNLTFIVDAAQTAGVLPIDLRKDHIDILCTAGHKGLYGPTGTGVLCMRETIPLQTILEGGTGSLSASLQQPDFYPDRLESGTVNTVGICGLDAGLQFVRSRTPERLYAHEYGLCRQVYDALSSLPQYCLYTPSYIKGKIAPIVLFNHRKKNSVELVEQLNERGYCLRGGLHCAPLGHRKIGTIESGAVRFSPGAFTTPAEIRRFLQDLYRII